MPSAMTSLKYVGLLTAGMCIVTWTGVFDTVLTENGPDHYAEKSWGPFIDLVPMPLNTVINFGYVIIGGSWLFAVKRMQRERTLQEKEAAMFYPFLWMSVFYGPIQMARILTQEHRWAVMDQWYTLPFFAWVVVWGRSNNNQTTSRLFTQLIMFSSVSSYGLTLVTSVGFEIALGLHVLGAVICGLLVYRQHRNQGTTFGLVMASLCCSMFVLLKLLDHTLPSVHPIFNYISGHFLSKIADVLQIHYTAYFFFYCSTDKSKKP